MGTSVNVERAVAIGSSDERVSAGSTNWFLWGHSRRVHTVAETKTGVVVGPKVLYDTELIYSRVIGLQASTRDVDIKNVLSYEQSPVPTALFEESRDMRICKSKADMKNNTRVEISERNQTEMNCTVLDSVLYYGLLPGQLPVKPIWLRSRLLWNPSRRRYSAGSGLAMCICIRLLY